MFRAITTYCNYYLSIYGAEETKIMTRRAVKAIDAAIGKLQKELQLRPVTVLGAILRPVLLFSAMTTIFTASTTFYDTFG